MRNWVSRVTGCLRSASAYPNPSDHTSLAAKIRIQASGDPIAQSKDLLTPGASAGITERAELRSGLPGDSLPCMEGVREDLAAALADRYAIDRVLGRGGMATVYVAEDRRHSRQVAIKVLRSDVAAAIGAERFLREITIAARLTHPHVLPLIDSGQAAGSLS